MPLVEEEGNGGMRLFTFLRNKHRGGHWSRLVQVSSGDSKFNCSALRGHLATWELQSSTHLEIADLRANIPGLAEGVVGGCLARRIERWFYFLSS